MCVCVCVCTCVVVSVPVGILETRGKPQAYLYRIWLFDRVGLALILIMLYLVHLFVGEVTNAAVGMYQDTTPLYSNDGNNEKEKK